MIETSKSTISVIRGAVKEQGVAFSERARISVEQAEPLRLWIIQVGIIVCTASLLSLVLKKIRQPKVIAEVLGGILLGPTAFGRIPGFTEKIFPIESRGYLALTANIGLCLFLFLVGLEIDAGVVRRNARLSATVALAGMILPFTLGAAFSMPLYHHFISPEVQYTHFMLFTGVAYSITAFPVLCRILTELKLLDTTVGIVVLSAGVGNDVVGWTLLALCVALVNAGSETMALWILLGCIAWTAFLLIPMRHALGWLAKRTDSIESGPTLFFMTVTMMIMLGSAFVTDIIGVHAIFGAFITGLIVPREGGLTVALAEKLEDMVAIIFLPLYFTLSGLSTDLGLLNDGLTLAFTIAIMTLAFVGKFGGCTLAAHYFAQFNWRESATIGSLMSCKGLVELIVLNVGLSAGILNQRVFSMFVLEALVLTFMTTPLVTTLYPPQFRIPTKRSPDKFHEASEEAFDRTEQTPRTNKDNHHFRIKQRPQLKTPVAQEVGDHHTTFTVVLDRIEHLLGAVAVTQLIKPSSNGSVHEEQSDSRHLQRNGCSRCSTVPATGSIYSSISYTSSTTRPPIINALRLIKLTDRVSAVMKSHDTSTLLHSDPLLSIYRMFALLQGVKVFGEVDVVPEEEMSVSTIEKANRSRADMIVVPWIIHSSNSAANVLATNVDGWNTQPQPPTEISVLDPFKTSLKVTSRYGTFAPPSNARPLSSGNTEMCHRSSENTEIRSQSRAGGLWSLAQNATHSRFIRKIFARAEMDVGVYIDQSGGRFTCLSHSELPPGASAARTGTLDSPLGPTGNEQLHGKAHIFLPFFGGSDDRFALEFVIGLCHKNEQLRATIVRLKSIEGTVGTGAAIQISRQNGGIAVRAGRARSADAAFPDQSPRGLSDKHVGVGNRLQSEAVDELIWSQYASSLLRSDSSSDTASSSKSLECPMEQMPRVTFKEVTTSNSLRAALEESYSIQQFSGNVGVVVVTGRSHCSAAEHFRFELSELMQEGGVNWGHSDIIKNGMLEEVRNTVGDVASTFVGRSVGVGVWVLQSASSRER